MPAMQVIETTKTLWGIPPQVHGMLRSANQKRQAVKNSPRSDVCSHREGKRLPQQGRDLSGIEVTTTSFFNHRWE